MSLRAQAPAPERGNLHRDFVGAALPGGHDISQTRRSRSQ